MFAIVNVCVRCHVYVYVCVHISMYTHIYFSRYKYVCVRRDVFVFLFEFGYFLVNDLQTHPPLKESMVRFFSICYRRFLDEKVKDIFLKKC